MPILRSYAPGNLVSYLASLAASVPNPLKTVALHDKGGQVYDIKAYGAVCDGTTDDTAAWNAAITAASTAGGGIVFHPGGTSLISASLTLKRGVSVMGVMPSVTPRTSASWDLGFTVSGGSIITFPGGTVFTQNTTPGTGTASAIDGIAIECLGFNNVASILTCGATNTSGLNGAMIRSIVGSNVTGTAFNLKNIMHVYMQQVNISDVYQLLVVTSDYDSTVVNNQPGNSYFSDLYAYVTTAGMAVQSVVLQTLNPNSHGTSLNFCHFQRLQINRFANSVQAGGHLALLGSSASSIVNGCTFDSLDLEGFAQYRIQLSFANKTRMHLTGVCAANVAADLYVRSSVYNHMTNMDDNLVLDMDDTASPLLWDGVLKSITGGLRYPIGTWWNKTNGAADLALSKSAVIDTTSFPVWSMPETYFDFTSNGGGVRPRRTAWNSAAVLTLNKATMGIVELTFAGATSVTLPDATTCPRQEVTFKQTAATGSVCTISTQLSQTIDGAATNTWLDTQYKYLTLYSNGTTWLIRGKG